MADVSQTNATLNEIAHALRAHEQFCLCGHVSPDGDCIGSQLGLASMLRAAGKQVVCLLARDDEIDRNIAFLPGADELMPAGAYEGSCEVFVALDVSVRDRLGDAAAIHGQASLSVTVDHHAADELISDLSYIDPGIASTTMLVWELAKQFLAEKFHSASCLKDLATCCYLGLMTDTGRFQFQNVDASSFSLASEMVAAGAEAADIAQRFYQNRNLASVRLEGAVLSRMVMPADGAIAISWVTLDDMKTFDAVKADVDPLVDSLRSIRGVRVACMLRENDDEVRVSLRSKDDTDVSVLARDLGGGGHKAAAGCSVALSIKDAVAYMSARLQELLADAELPS